MHIEANDCPLVVVGGGITGLAVAAEASEDGRSVILPERASDVGGRGRSDGPEGCAVNLGPHALFPRSHELLARLGVEVHGGSPNRGLTMRVGGRVHPFPDGVIPLFGSGALPISGKLALARRLAQILISDPAKLDGTSVREWLGAALPDDRARQIVEAIVRVSTYSNAPDRMSAGAFIRQIRSAAVRYIDGGWQTIVDALAARAIAQRVEVRTRASASAIVIEDGRAIAVEADGQRIACSDVVVTLSPKATVALLGDAAPTELMRFAERAVTLRLACLDVALRSLPRPHPRVILGVDEPTYLSVHSKVARLAPGDRAVIHVARYLAPEERVDAPAMRASLEAELDVAQSGWREVLIEARFSPAMTVMHAMPEAAMNGTRGRPAIDAAGIDGVLLAGDWVGPDGLLLDACLESARTAAERLRGRVRAAA